MKARKLAQCRTMIGGFGTIPRLTRCPDTSGTCEHRPKRKSKLPDPPVYLSRSGGRFRVIDRGVPICSDQATEGEALAIAKSWTRGSHVYTVSDRMWDGDAGKWITRTVLTLDGAT